MDMSSSSSSGMEIADGRLLPFKLKIKVENAVTSFAFFRDLVYAGFKNTGQLLESSDQENWSVAYTVDDYSVEALIVFDDKLFIGTGAAGKVYTMDSDGAVTLNKTIGKTVKSFVVFDDDLYLGTRENSEIYKFDEVTEEWSMIYDAFGGSISSMLADDKMYVFCEDSKNFYIFDGFDWSLGRIDFPDNLASFRKISVEPFSESNNEAINRSEVRDPIAEGLSEEDRVSIFPINYCRGIKSSSWDNGAILAGSQNNGSVFRITTNNEIKRVFQTDKSFVNSILNISSGSDLVSIGSVLYVAYRNTSAKDVYRFIPILDLENEEYITTMALNSDVENVLIGTNNGRIISVSDVTLNAYMAGETTIYVDAKDNFGNETTEKFTEVFYGLTNKIMEINEDKEVIKYKYEVDPAAKMADYIKAVFVSPVLEADVDMGFWKQLTWREDKPDDTEIVICIRYADTRSELLEKEWDVCFCSNANDSGYSFTGTITRDLDNITERFIQFRVTMTSESENVTPTLVNLGIAYVTKFAVYFYTTKFVMQTDTKATKGFITANMTEPSNTKIKFGIVNTNSADFNDYTLVEPEKLFDINSFDRLKVGVKLISSDAINYPELAEFAFLTSGDKQTLLNE